MDLKDEITEELVINNKAWLGTFGIGAVLFIAVFLFLHSELFGYISIVLLCLSGSVLTIKIMIILYNRYLREKVECYRAEKKLLRYKQLEDAGIITSAEYKRKLIELKKKII